MPAPEFLFSVIIFSNWLVDFLSNPDYISSKNRKLGLWISAFAIEIFFLIPWDKIRIFLPKYLDRSSFLVMFIIFSFGFLTKYSFEKNIKFYSTVRSL